MISRIEKAGISLELEAEVKKYIDKKVGCLDRFMPRSARKSAHAEVKLREASNKTGDKYECEVILHLPDQQLAAKESTLTMLAAIDIVEAKLKAQLKKYKDEQTEQRHGGRRRLLNKLNIFRHERDAQQGGER
ncbi:MAG TPA: ribosome-associated translation inhibitor RaiA [Candidatus Acidoferrum sp.]|nr:ribosome-associated translation inhibitor RaiA [Candidatus Acidoferrum sp.]